MISPIDFKVSDFIESIENERLSHSLLTDNIHGSDLIDNLILLRFIPLVEVQKVLKEAYSMPFAWLNIDPTPAEYADIAAKHNVFIQRGKNIIVYVPIGTSLDDALLRVDIPQYQLDFRFIADCNYQMIKYNLSPTVLSYKLAPFRELLVLKRLIVDCIECCGTDIHFESRFEDKVPVHVIRYRVKRELVYSNFVLDKDLMQRVIQSAVQKLSSSCVADLDSASGVTTEIADIFKDGTCDLRFTGGRDAAGFYVVIAIQTTTTTTKKVDELGLPVEDVKVLRELSKRRTGLTLITGEMRSGKNTTIFAMLNEILDEPIRIIEYSNPIENRMPFPQIDYHGDIELLTHYMRMAKKQDLDIAVLNEIPNQEVAFAVRDLVNSAVGVITTTHLNRVWHIPNKLREFFKEDYKTIISQLNAVVNHKMFRRWSAPGMQKRILVKEQGEFEMNAYKSGVRQYFVPTDINKVRYELQPLIEVIVLTDPIKSSMLNFEDIWRAEQMIQLQVEQAHGTIENKLAAYINEGLCSLDEMRHIF